MSIRILVADTSRAWRRELRSVLQARQEWEIDYEASEGSEAIQKAEELKPDVALLETGLSKPNGMEVARRIHQLSPKSRIVFMSLDNSLEVLQSALSTGAQGYVYKPRAGTDLLPAIDAVLRGETFVSSSLEGYQLTDIVEAKVPHHHELLFYSDDTVFLDGSARFIAAALQSDNVAIALVTKSHQESLVQRLKAEGLDIDGAIQQGAFILLEVADTLATFMVDGLADPVRFFESFSGLIEAALKSAKSEHPRVAFCGECIGRLWAEGKTDAAIRLEQSCNDLAKTHDVDLLCAYPFSGSRDEERTLQSICAEHSAVRRE